MVKHGRSHAVRVAVGIALAAALAAAGFPADAPVMALKAAMVDRLGAMSDVAHYKWNARAAVEDRAQEAAVVAAAVGAAQETGLDAHVVRRAIEAQIDAAKQVQFAVTESLKARGAGRIEDVPDLDTSLRPRIGAATKAVVDNLAPALPSLRQCDMAAALRARPAALAAFPEAWDAAADGVIAAAGGPDRQACRP